VRLATKLVGWNIDIRSEEEIKREVTEQMGALIASGASVPLSVIEGLTVQQTDVLAEHGINDIDALTQTSLDDLVEFLDLSLDEAEVILNAAKAVVAVRDRALQGDDEEAAGESESSEDVEGAEAETGETDEAEAVSVEADEIDSADESETADDSTAAGYDEAVEKGVPYHAEPEILAQDSADPVALTEVEPYTEDELVLQEAGRDLRPDTIVPAPDITSAEAAAIESLEEFVADEAAVAAESEEAADTTVATQTSAPAVLEEAASSESTDEEKQDASPDAAN
jgi:N utilization substance protein A